jgi:SMP-30/Gluconolactonase/LRE-like region
MKMATYRRLPAASLVAAGLLLSVSTSALAAGTLTRVLTTSPPNLPESISIDHNGDMFLSLPFANKVIEVTPSGAQSTVATFPSMFPLGVRLDYQGDAFIAVVGSGIWEVPAGGGAARQLASGPGLWNGLAFDHRGNLFVSDSGGGAIWRLGGDGSFMKWSDSSLLQGTTGPGPCGLVHPAVPSFGPLGANGLAFDARGDLLVANTDFGEVIRIPTNPDGSAGTASVLAGPSCDLWGADGVAMDTAGNLYVAANAKGQIDRVDSAGNLEVLAAGSPLSFPSDLAFGTGITNRVDAFICNFAAFPTSDGAPGVLELAVGIPGRPIG